MTAFAGAPRLAGPRLAQGLDVRTAQSQRRVRLQKAS